MTSFVVDAIAGVTIVRCSVNLPSRYTKPASQAPNQQQALIPLLSRKSSGLEFHVLTSKLSFSVSCYIVPRATSTLVVNGHSPAESPSHTIPRCTNQPHNAPENLDEVVDPHRRSSHGEPRSTRDCYMFTCLFSALNFFECTIVIPIMYDHSTNLCWLVITASRVPWYLMSSIRVGGYGQGRVLRVHRIGVSSMRIEIPISFFDTLPFGPR